MRYITRSLEPILLQAAQEFPVVVLTGPRQSGKTTLLQHCFAADYQYISLEPPDVRAAATEDPRGFLALYPSPVIFDEIQYTSALLPYIKEQVDAQRQRSGQYLLTGSQNILLSQNITESLAGRAAMLRLLPLSYREMTGAPEARLPWETETPAHRTPIAYAELWNTFLRGGYPELTAQPQRDLSRWHASYVQTYLERDVRTLRQVGDLSQFQIFLRALAARSAQLLNLSDLSRDLGLAVNTIKAWLSVLEATYQIHVLRPYFANIGKRLVKTPKVYFADVGTLCYLAGLKDPEHAIAGPMGGAIMETAVVHEVIRTLTHRGADPTVYFWRTSTGVEVDLIIDTGPNLVPIEIKLTATPNRNMAKGIDTFCQDMRSQATKGYVIHPGDVTLPLGPHATAWPFAQL